MEHAVYNGGFYTNRDFVAMGPKASSQAATGSEILNVGTGEFARLAFKYTRCRELENGDLLYKHCRNDRPMIAVQHTHWRSTRHHSCAAHHHHARLGD